ncbi:hypothetical protein [Acinetobacter indicus]|uniref:hypothetical protein n=1 Tax=Acinetobacter indicus TaxID=756892 RepID=UPI0012E10A93|nr:hypothetical protein [Acinetobacter indicus]
MNQYPSHSQTPKFDSNKSQTSQILYQEPTPEEMKRRSNAFNNFFAFLVLFALFFGLACMIIVTAERESANQVEATAKAASHSEIEKINAAIAGGVK